MALGTRTVAIPTQKTEAARRDDKLPLTAPTIRDPKKFLPVTSGKVAKGCCVDAFWAMPASANSRQQPKTNHGLAVSELAQSKMQADGVGIGPAGVEIVILMSGFQGPSVFDRSPLSVRGVDRLSRRPCLFISQ